MADIQRNDGRFTLDDLNPGAVNLLALSKDAQLQGRVIIDLAPEKRGPDCGW